MKAISNKKHVITANKAVIFHHGDEIFNAANKNGVKVLFEAAVCAGTPIIKLLSEELAANNISKISGMLLFMAGESTVYGLPSNITWISVVSSLRSR